MGNYTCNELGSETLQRLQNVLPTSTFIVLNVNKKKKILSHVNSVDCSTASTHFHLLR